MNIELGHVIAFCIGFGVGILGAAWIGSALSEYDWQAEDD